MRCVLEEMAEESRILMIDAVLSLHTNPHVCGVAKFSARLARELGVPFLKLSRHPVAHPLISIKSSEDEEHGWPMIAGWYKHFDLFLHDYPNGIASDDIVRRADHVFVANRVIAEGIRHLREDVIESWCPSTVEGSVHRGQPHVLTFGMASKLTSPYYEKLKTLLDDTGKDYTIGLSCAVHEGSPWDSAMADTETRMRAIFGNRLRVLGYLGDDALAKEIRDCHAVAVFYDPALRENNTTYWTAADAFRPVVTNLDALSPRWTLPYDINTMTRWPPYMHSPGSAADHGWDTLVEMVRMQPCAK